MQAKRIFKPIFRGLAITVRDATDGNDETSKGENKMTNRRTTIAQIRFEKNETATLQISGILGNFSLGMKDKKNAVIRVSQIGNQFTVYVKAYSKVKQTFRDIKYFDNLESAVLNANKLVEILIQNGFKIVY